MDNHSFCKLELDRVIKVMQQITKFQIEPFNEKNKHELCVALVVDTVLLFSQCYYGLTKKFIE